MAATLTRMLTGREPSAFMAITSQSPLWTVQVSVWVPGPAARAAQMPARAGGSNTRGGQPISGIPPAHPVLYEGYG